jgi:hypothetical protein
MDILELQKPIGRIRTGWSALGDLAEELEAADGSKCAHCAPPKA